MFTPKFQGAIEKSLGYIGVNLMRGLLVWCFHIWVVIRRWSLIVGDRSVRMPLNSTLCRPLLSLVHSAVVESRVIGHGHCLRREAMDAADLRRKTLKTMMKISLPSFKTFFPGILSQWWKDNYRNSVSREPSVVGERDQHMRPLDASAEDQTAINLPRVPGAQMPPSGLCRY